MHTAKILGLILAPLTLLSGVVLAQDETLNVSFVVARHPDPDGRTIPLNWRKSPVQGALIQWEHWALINGQRVGPIWTSGRTDEQGILHIPRADWKFAQGAHFRAVVIADGFIPEVRQFQTLTFETPCEAPNFPGLCTPNQTFLVFLKPVGTSSQSATPTSSVGTEYFGELCDPNTFIQQQVFGSTSPPVKLPCYQSTSEIGCSHYSCDGEGLGTPQFRLVGDDKRSFEVTNQFNWGFTAQTKALLGSFGIEVGATQEQKTVTASSTVIDMEWGTANRKGMIGMVCVMHQPYLLRGKLMIDKCVDKWVGHPHYFWLHVVNRFLVRDNTTTQIHIGSHCVFDTLKPCQ